MAVDMTNLTTAQYRQRIEEMSIKEIQKKLNFWKAPVTTVKDWYVQTE